MSRLCCTPACVARSAVFQLLHDTPVASSPQFAAVLRDCTFAHRLVRHGMFCSMHSYVARLLRVITMRQLHRPAVPRYQQHRTAAAADIPCSLPCVSVARRQCTDASLLLLDVRSC